MFAADCICDAAISNRPATQTVIYQNGGGTNTNIQGLQNGQSYFVVVIDSTTFALSQTLAGALAGVLATTPTVLTISPGTSPGKGQQWFSTRCSPASAPFPSTRAA